MRWYPPKDGFILIFQRYIVCEKKSNAFLNGGGNMNPCSQLLTFKFYEYWGIVGSQIEIKIIFSLVSILISLKKYHS
jgi:hypothetical protein